MVPEHLATQRLRQEDHESQTSQGHIVSPRSDCNVQRSCLTNHKYTHKCAINMGCVIPEWPHKPMLLCLLMDILHTRRTDSMHHITTCATQDISCRLMEAHCMFTSWFLEHIQMLSVEWPHVEGPQVVWWVIFIARWMEFRVFVKTALGTSRMHFLKGLNWEKTQSGCGCHHPKEGSCTE